MGRERETRALRAVSSRDETLSGLPVRYLPCLAMDKEALQLDSGCLLQAVGLSTWANAYAAV